MKNDVLVINIAVSIIILLGMTCYFALTPNEDLSRANLPIYVEVSSHGYQPAMIQVHAGKEVKLHIVRDSMETCKSGIEFQQMNAAYPFMLDIPINVTLPPQVPGVIDFKCKDGNARGRIVIV